MPSAEGHLNWDYWIFDLDGTLTIAVHDFDAIRDTLGLPPGVPILEALGRLPPDTERRLMRRLDEIELGLARRAVRRAGTFELLDILRRRGARLGIVTRNCERAARETLRVCGLQAFFHHDDVIARERAKPKPDPDGVHRLLRRWGVAADRAVVVGDYVFDLQAGRAAGTGTIYVGSSSPCAWAEHADTAVPDLESLRSLIAANDD